MKKLLIAFSIFLSASVLTNAQDIDTLAVVPSVSIDSTYLGRNIFEVMPSRMKGDAAGVVINQDNSIRSSLQQRTAANSFKEINGYRVRIYFSNAQNARSASSEAAARFAECFPGYPIYRSYNNPNFKVTVGDFRTESEALRLREAVKGVFPAAFIVKEKIKN